MKKPFAHSVTIPSSGIPLPASEAVATIQDLRELDTTEARNGEKRCRLHFDHDAAFALSTCHLHEMTVCIYYSAHGRVPLMRKVKLAIPRDQSIT